MQMSTRRQFIQSAGFGLLASSMNEGNIFGSGIQKRKLSMQLYTVRDQIKEDISGTLQRLSRIGFKNVETAFWPEGISLDRAAALLKENNLHVSSCHIEIPLGEGKKAFIDTAKAFDCTDMIWHGWPEDRRYSTLEGTRELIGLYNASGKFAKDNGLHFGLHNHWWEFRNLILGPCWGNAGLATG